jgi:hypothetical protein
MHYERVLEVALKTEDLVLEGRGDAQEGLW